MTLRSRPSRPQPTVLRAAFALSLICAWVLAAAGQPAPRHRNPLARQRGAAPAAPSPRQWLLTHARLPGPVGGPKAVRALRTFEAWIPARGRPDPVNRAQVLFLDSVELETPLTRKGRALNRRQAAAAARQLDLLRRRVRAAWHGRQDDGRLVIVGSRVQSAQTLLNRFDWRRLGDGSFLGRPCRRFAFSPRPGLRIGNRTARVLAAMAGTVCADPATGLVYQVHFHNQEPVRFGWGLLGDFRGIRGSFRLQRLDGHWTWGQIVVRLQGRELWFDKSGTLIKRYQLAPTGTLAAR
ncbi:MAG: hypothetical protein ACRD2E_08260 [Terriglobales bacterium]